MIIDSSQERDKEIVFGIVCPIGTALDEVVLALGDQLHAYGYEHEVIRMSRLLDDTAQGGEGSDLPSDEHREEYYLRRMEAGDTLRTTFNSGDALAAYAVASIRDKRGEESGDSKNQRRRKAWILRTLKHPDEADLLRTVYGERFVLLGVSSPPSERERTLVATLGKQTGIFDRDALKRQARGLMDRDERDADNRFGQNVGATFAMADAFVDVRRGLPSRDAVQRIVKLLFGEPFLTPTRDEQSMFHAYASALRSSAFGRQVGAALSTVNGEVLAEGTNEVPRPGGGEYWYEDNPDHRDFMHGVDFNTQTVVHVVANLMANLKTGGWLDEKHKDTPAQELAIDALKSGGPLSGSRIRDAIEYGRISHAEMSAICNAARRGVSTQGAILHTTTYPCHMCARLIINAGISRVVYIDPYQKSLVPEMYGDLISEGDEVPSQSRIEMSRFVGIAPRLFARVFSAVNREKDAYGEAVQPHLAGVAAFRLAERDSMAEADTLEAGVTIKLGQVLEALDGGCPTNEEDVEETVSDRANVGAGCNDDDSREGAR